MFKNKLTLFPLIGLIQGLALEEVLGRMGDFHTATSLLLLVFLAFTPILFYFTHCTDRPGKALIFSVFSGGLLAALYTWTQGRFNGGFPIENDPAPAAWAVAATFAAAIIALLFGRLLIRDADGGTPYDRIYNGVWTFSLSAILAAAFTGLFWFLLFLWWSLFDLIGISLFKEIFQNDYVIAATIGGSIGAAIAVTLQQERILTTARSLVLALLKLLAPFTAILLAVFLVALPIMGFDPLWDTDSATTILMTLVLAAGIFTNAIVQTSDIDIPAQNHRLQVLSAKALCLLLPFPSAIGVYAVWLRVDQYGLTPERIMGCIIVGFALLFSVGYAIAILRRAQWAATMRKVNFTLIGAGGIVAMMLMTPVGDLYRLSVSSQIARLESGRTTPEEFDYGTLRFYLGSAGDQALAELEAGQHLPAGVDITADLKAVDAADHYYDWVRYREGQLFEAQPFDLEKWQSAFLVRPATAAFPDDLAKLLSKSDWRITEHCLNNTGPGHCAFIIGDIFPGGADEVVVASRNEDYRNISFVYYRQIETEDGTSVWAEFYRDQRMSSYDLTTEDLWHSIVSGDISFEPAGFNTIQLGDKTRLLELGSGRPLMIDEHEAPAYYPPTKPRPVR